MQIVVSNSPDRITAVSLDGDGTLWDFEKVMRHSLNHALAELRRAAPTAAGSLTIDTMITVGDRTLSAVKPPAFDNPSTTGFYDDKSGVFFSSDCFGALLSEVPQKTRETFRKRTCGRDRSPGRR